MQVTLTPELERMVGEKVASGGESGWAWLRREATLGFAQLDAGESLDITREEFLEQMHQSH